MEVSMCQKIINVLAVASCAVSGAVVVSGVYVYLNRTSIIDGVKSQIMESVTGSMGGGALTGDVGVPAASGSPASGLGVASF